MSEWKMNRGIIPFPQEEKRILKVQINPPCCNKIQYIFSVYFSLYISLDVKIWINRRQTTQQVHRLFWNGKNASWWQRHVIYAFECLFNLIFLVQCVNTKAMSWSSMVEYRDLCKLFFKLKIKEIDITLMQRVVWW